MKVKIFLLRNQAFLIMLVLTVISSMLALIMHSMISGSGQTFAFPWMLFGDTMLPLFLFLLAQKFGNRYCSLAAILFSFINIFLRIFSIVIFKQTYMPLDYDSVRLLAYHTDLYALNAVLGSGYMYWLFPLTALIFSTVVYCGIISWKTTGMTHRPTNKKWMIFFSVLLGLALISNLSFQVINYCTSKDNDLPVRPLPIVILSMAQDVFKQLSVNDLPEPVKLSDESKKILEKWQIIAPPDDVQKDTAGVFDKIIIIAIESLDYDFISAFNPQMPAGVTPNLDRLSKKYPSMENYFAATQPTNWGLHSIISSRIDYTKDRIIKPETMFSVSREHGYYSIYYSAASGHYGDNRRIYKELFQPDETVFMEEFQKRYDLKQVARWGLSDNNVFQGVIKELKKIENQRFIAVISTVDTHPPYYTHKKPSKKKFKKFSSDFLQTLHNTDCETGRFIDKIMADKKLFDERTLLIITADHTATFGSNYLNRKELIPGRVPLIFISENKDAFSALNTKKYASSLDLAPTILELIGVKKPDSFMGRSLFSAKNCAITWLLSNQVFVYYPDSSETSESAIYINLNNPDPEKNNISTAFRDFFHAYYGKPQLN